MTLRDDQVLRTDRYELRVTRTPDELEAVARLRYDVYVAELGRNRAYANHEARTLHEALDGESVVIGAFTPDGGAIGTIRLTPSTAPGLGCREIYRWEERERTCPTGVFIGSKLMVAEEHRGTRLSLEIIRFATQQAQRRGWRYCFLETYDNLIPLYERVGFVIRSHSTHPVYGAVTIMELDLLDVGHMRAVRSPLLEDALAYLAEFVCAA